MEEIWKDIEGFEGYYQVSNLGRVKGLERTVKHYTGGIKKLNQIILKLCKDFKGYFNIQLSKNGISKTYKAHRLVAKHFIPNFENKLEVNHKNGVKTDNSAINLEWCSCSENIIHAFKTGLKKAIRGEKNGNSKITENIAYNIKYNTDGLSQKEIANQYEISQSLVSSIKNGKKWKHIK
jgi:hypothetical protein